MKKAQTLSIVIPVYNEEDYIGNCLQAIAHQTVMPDEVIVVDNNSTDNSAAIAAHFPFVKVIREPKQGLFHARNAGMNAAKGDILGRIDADTQLTQNWVKEVKKAFRSSKVAALTGPVGYYDMPLPNFTCWLEDGFLRVARKLGYEFLVGANMALSRETWQKLSPKVCNELFIYEDIDLAIHLAEAKLTAKYSPKLKAKMSARRFADSPADFTRYIGGHTRTLEFHDKHTIGAHFAEFVFLGVYFLAKPLHMVFDPVARQLDFGRLGKKATTRPDPMNVPKINPLD